MESKSTIIFCEMKKNLVLKTKGTKIILKGTRYPNRLVYLNASIINIETSENRDIM